MHNHTNTHLFTIPKFNQEKLGQYTQKFKKKKRGYSMKQPPTFSSSSTSNLIRKARLSPYIFTLFAFIVFVTILYGQDLGCILGQFDRDIIRDRPPPTPSKFFRFNAFNFQQKKKYFFFCVVWV